MNLSILNHAMEAVRRTLPSARPSCALVMGSGWGSVIEGFDVRADLDYGEIPGLGAPSVQGHAGRLILATVHGLEILIFQGRRHWYEGEGWEPVAIPVFVSAGLGVPILLLTNSAGSIREDLQPGDLMLISDHINAIRSNPLIGEHLPVLGPRFPDQTRVYDPLIRRQFVEAARTRDITIHEGVYLAATGPNYETPAEVRAFRGMGADAVGMSTVPEAILANSMGLRVAGISCITNLAAHDAGGGLSHDEVIARTDEAKPRMRALLTEWLAGLGTATDSGT